MVPAGSTSSGEALTAPGEGTNVVCPGAGAGIRVGEGMAGTNGLIAGGAALVEAAGTTGRVGKMGSVGTGAGAAAAGPTTVFVDALDLGNSGTVGLVADVFVEGLTLLPPGCSTARWRIWSWFVLDGVAGRGEKMGGSDASALAREGP